MNEATISRESSEPLDAMITTVAMSRESLGKFRNQDEETRQTNVLSRVEY